MQLAVDTPVEPVVREHRPRTVPAEEPRLLQRYMPQLDVLRGLAILMVFLDHGLYWLGAQNETTGIARKFALLTSGGWLGVNLFFVLSGFLITGILLDGRESEDYYRRFYLRRVLRILPIYTVLLVILAFTGHMSHSFFLLSITFLTNYSASFGITQGYGVLWSLSVEEQFYLVWPGVVRRCGIRALAWLCCGLIVLEPVLRFASATHRAPLGDVHSSTILIADNLACGALAAILVRSPRFGTVREGRKWGLATVAVALGLELLGLPFGIVHRDTLIGATFQTTPWNLFFTGLLVWMLSLHSDLFCSPWTRPLRFLGYISYGLYLMHMLVFELYAHMTAGVPGTLGETLRGSYIRLLCVGILSVIFSWCSRRYFEAPFLSIRVGRPERKLPQLSD